MDIERLLNKELITLRNLILYEKEREMYNVLIVPAKKYGVNNLLVKGVYKEDNSYKTGRHHFLYHPVLPRIDELLFIDKLRYPGLEYPRLMFAFEDNSLKRFSTLVNGKLKSGVPKHDLTIKELEDILINIKNNIKKIVPNYFPTIERIWSNKDYKPNLLGSYKTD